MSLALFTQARMKERSAFAIVVCLAVFFASMTPSIGWAKGEDLAPISSAEDFQCRVKNWYQLRDWRHQVNGVFERKADQYRATIRDYEAARVQIDQGMVTIFGIDSRKRMAYYTGKIALWMQTIADTMINVLAALTGKAGQSVNYAYGISQEVGTRLSQGYAIADIATPLAVRVGVTALGNKFDVVAAGAASHTDVSNYRRLANLKSEWEMGVTVAREQHELFDRNVERLKAALGRMEQYQAETDIAYDAIRRGIVDYCLRKHGSEDARSAESDEDRRGVSSSARSALDRLRKRTAEGTSSDWNSLNSSMSGRSDRLRRNAQEASVRFRRDAEYIYQQMLEASLNSMNQTMQEIARRNEKTLRRGRSVNCSQANQKIAAYEDWLAQARRTYSDSGISQVGRSIQEVENSLTAERAEARRMNCR